MNALTTSKRRYLAMGSVGLSVILGLVYFTTVDNAHAGPFGRFWRDKNCDSCASDDGTIGGSWYWMRSPDEEKRVVMGLYNRYCVRCHGVDGRGVWDIPGVPNFTNERWQETRSDKDIARIIIEGATPVMPPFRGTMTLEEGARDGPLSMHVRARHRSASTRPHDASEGHAEKRHAEREIAAKVACRVERLPEVSGVGPVPLG